MNTQRLAEHVGPALIGAGIGTLWWMWGLPVPFFVAVFGVAFALWAIAQLVMLVVSGTAMLYVDPKGTSTPHKAEYSQAKALAAQGRYEEAVAAYEIAAAESGGDPTPYIAIARIQRDQLGDHEAAAGWFRRVRRDATLTPGLELLVAQELVELYTKKLGQPRRAIPELARIPGLAPGTAQAEAAERELATLRARLLDEEEDRPPP
jgi:hypothetical protein